MTTERHRLPIERSDLPSERGGLPSERGGLSIERRRLLRSAVALLGLGAANPLALQPRASELRRDAFPPVLRGTPLSFPRDHGAHPAFRTEWWYLTGWLRRLEGPQSGDPAGVQVTFFRSRTQHDPANPSRFAPTQLLFAHAALAIPERGKLLHAQRAARAGLGLAEASESDTAIAIGPWTLRRQPNDDYVAKIDAGDFALDLVFRPRAMPLLQGDAGFSRKGPRESQASFYYSRPQLQLSGRIVERSEGTTVDNPAASAAGPSATTAVDGVAWLDHEWSSEILDPSASGWDWVGLNFDDGSALMAFRIREKNGGVLWTDARWSHPAREAAGGLTRDATRGLTRDTARAAPAAPVAPEAPVAAQADAEADAPRTRAEVRFEPLRHWTSPRTGTRYPVSMRVVLDGRTLTLEPLLDDQELDTRGTTAVVYWEGAVRVIENGSTVGRGYLELTGYGEALRM